MSAVKGIAGAVVVGAVLAGGLYAGDRYALARAEEYARGVVSQSVSATQQPVVDIRGFPFLTQLASGTLDDVTASVGAASLNGIPVTDIAIEARQVVVRPPAGQQSTAGTASVVATIPVTSIERVVADRTGLQVALAVKGAALEASGTVLGLPLTVGLAPRVAAGRLLADVGAVTLAGRQVAVSTLPSGLRDRLTGIQVPVDGLPPGLTLTQATVVPAGVRITATGSNVAVGSPVGTPAPT